MAGQCIRMLMGSASSLMVLLLMLSQRPLVEAVDKNVNLIYPLIKEANFESNCLASHLTNCTMSLKTRAAQYKLENTDLLDGKNGSLVRVGEFKQPQSLIDSDYRFISEIEAFTGRQVNYVEFVEGKLKELKISNGFMIMNNAKNPAYADRFLICEALSNRFKVGEELAWACSRDNVIRFRIGDSNYASPLPPSDFTLPFSAIAIQASLAEDKQNVSIEMVLFDLAGVVSVIKGSYQKQTGSAPKLNQHPIHSTLSPIEWPMKDTGTKPALLIKNILPEDISKNLTYDWERKAKSAYVQSVTQDGIDGPICFTQRPINPNQEKFCMAESGEIELKPSYTAGDGAKILVHAHHRNSAGGNISNIHLAYSIPFGERPTETRYMFCPVNNNLDKIELRDPPQTNINCQPVQIRYPPNDIIGFKDGNCSRTIAFYDSIYTVHPDNSSIQENDIGPPKVLKGLDFYITAAYAVNKTINFFTGTNTLVMINATLTGKDCDTLELDMATKKVTTSQDYLYARAFQKAGEDAMKSPYLFDWREFAEGDNDTLPAIASSWGSWGTDVIITVPTDPAKPKEKGESNVVIIGVGLILGTLIISAIVYLFCLRGSADDQPPQRRIKSRRAKTPPMGLDTGGAISSMKTVRSEHGMTTKSPMSKVGSKIAGSSMGTQKSRGSRRSKRSAGAKQQQQQQQPQPQEISAAPPAPAPAAPAEAPAAPTSPSKAVSKSPKSQRSSSPSGGFLKKTLSSPKSPKSSRKSKYGNQSPKAAKTLVANP